MTKIYVPASSSEDWRTLLADPIKHWRSGYSAKDSAKAWMENPNDFPPRIRSAFLRSELEPFRSIEMLLAFPEWKTPLPGSRRPSQSDVFALAKSAGRLVAITVEAKVSEPSDNVVSDWMDPPTPGKRERLRYLCDCLGLDLDQVDGIRYQLLHRTVSSLIEADRFGASRTLMLVHSLSPTNEWFEDFERFASLFDARAEINSIVPITRRRTERLKFADIRLRLGWVSG